MVSSSVPLVVHRPAWRRRRATEGERTAEEEKKKAGGKASNTASPPAKGASRHGKMVVVRVILVCGGQCEVAIEGPDTS